MNLMLRVIGGVTAALLCAVSWAFGAECVQTLVQVGTTNGQAQVDLSWASDADTFYEIYSATNLATGPWTLAVEEPLASTNLIGTLRLFSADKSRFFQVRKLDTQGPVIVNRYPGVGAVGVGSFATLSVALSDAIGVDTNSYCLTVNGGAPITPDSVGVTVSSNRFTYVPPIEAWGVFGATVTVSFACLDLKGNATYTEWLFVLEVEPVVAGNLLHLSTVQPAQRTDARSLMSLPPRPGVLFLGGLTLIEQTTNSLTFGYSGTHGLYVGAVLVSHDASNPFYRKITSLADDPANGRVIAYTQDVPLTEIVQEGSFSPEVFIPVDGQMHALGEDANLGVGIPYTYNREFALGPIEWPNMRLRPAELNVKLDGSIGLSCQIRDWRVTALGADFDSSLKLGVRSGVDIYSKIGSLSRTRTLGSEPLGYVGGFIGPVPVWIELQVAVDLSLAVSSEGAVSFDTGFDAYATAAASLDWTPDGGLTHSYGGSLNVVRVPLEVKVQLSAEADLYLKPRLSALVYSLAGASVDFRRGPSLKVAYPSYPLTDPFQAEITLSDKWSIHGTLTCVGVADGELPEVTFLSGARPIKTWYWPEITNIVFTVQPSNVIAEAGTWVTLVSSASGKPDPAYQWYQNGVAIPGKTLAQLGFTMGNSSIGTYFVVAHNSSQSVTSCLATVTTDMALIPAGSFQMGNNLEEDGYPDELPVHTVYVSAFYMDKYEVTWSKWKEFQTWAGTNGYDIGTEGWGKAENHPVQWVSWYDAVKWCNARSQREGKPFVYYTDQGFTTVYKTGGAIYPEVLPVYCKWSATGYRLPTEAEWEKAARGGLSGIRFPWGNTISHGRANYEDYYLGNHPDYNNGPLPYTSPAGSFAPNGYGLYDMAGNVIEWCWDWYDYYSSVSVTNPHGPSSEPPYMRSARVLRGGGWHFLPIGCRNACRQWGLPGYQTCGNVGNGFRTVLPLGQ